MHHRVDARVHADVDFEAGVLDAEVNVGGIQHERTRVVRARKKPGGPLFWLALVVALGAAGVAGYYASRLLEGTPSSAPEHK